MTATPADDNTRMTGPGGRRRRSSAEWITFAIASAILLAVVGAIVWLWLQGPTEPPSFTVRTEAAREAGGRYYVRTTVGNDGDETAEAVQVRAELEVGGDVVEESDQEIDFLSGGEEEAVEFVFEADPAGGSLSVGVSSYKVP